VTVLAATAQVGRGGGSGSPVPLDRRPVLGTVCLAGARSACWERGQHAARAFREYVQPWP